MPVRATGPKAVKSPLNSVDVYVGARLRMRRAMMGMSQSKLGSVLGVTFQQIQKYEKGVNRISASRLKQAAGAFDVDVDWFYEGGPAEHGAKPGLAEGTRSLDVQFLSTTEGFKLNRAFTRIRDPKIRRKIIDLVESLAPPDEDVDAVRLERRSLKRTIRRNPLDLSNARCHKRRRLDCRARRGSPRALEPEGDRAYGPSELRVHQRVRV